MTILKTLKASLAAAPILLALAGPAAAGQIGGHGGGMGGHMAMSGHGGMGGHVGGHGMHFAGGPHMGGHMNGHFHGDHHHGFRPHFVVGLPFYGYGPDYYYDDDYYDVGYADNAVARCEARYHSFDPASGTFLGYDGARHPCPYL